MNILTLENQNPFLHMSKIIEELNNGIIITRSETSENTEVNSYIISNDKLLFISSNSPSISMFLEGPKLSILTEMLKKRVFNVIVYEDFDKEFTFEKLIKFSKKYDKEFKGSSKEFYTKYKKFFIENC